MSTLFLSLNRYIGSNWPAVLPQWSGPEVLDRVWVAPLELAIEPDAFKAAAQMFFEDEISLSVPGVDALSLVLGCGGGGTAISVEVDLLPDFALRLPSLALAFRLQSEFLQPVRAEGGCWVPIRGADGRPAPIELPLEGVGLEADLDGDFEILMPSGAPQTGLGAVQLGETGVVLEIEGVALYFSRKQTPPLGSPPGWRGVVVESLKLHLPRDLNIPLESINFEGVRIGTGGFSGTIRGIGNATTYDAASGRFSGSGAGDICGLQFALSELMLEFKQNTLVGSKIEGLVILPFFDQPVLCEVRLTNNGDFTVAIAASQVMPDGIPAPDTKDGLFVFSKEGLFSLRLASIAFEKKGGDLAIQVGGALTPDFGGFTWPEFEVKALTIDSRGRVSIDGGWLDLPKQLTMDFYGFGLEVSKIGFGSEDDGSRWIGFSGGLKLCEGLSMSGAVEGLRIYWKGDEFWLTFSGASIAFEIPGSVAFSGRVALIDDGSKHGFKGSGRLKIIPTGLEVNADVVIGKNDASPAYTYFFIYLDTQLPAGIPLFSTGASVYGLAGLFAYNMEPNKGADVPWYDGWYKLPEIGVTNSDKWIDRRGSFALGAGVTLGTMVDDGYSVNARTVLVIVLPGPIIMIEGTTAFLNDRASSDGGMFRALAVLDNRVGQFLLNMEATYDCPKSGDFKLVEVHAGAEAFFDFHNSNNWHLFVGQREPREKRVRVKMLSLFESNFYLMLLPTQFEIGAWMGYDGKWKFGPLRIELQAWIEGYAFVSWKPVQFKGGLTLFGRVGLKAFGAGLDISLGAHVEVEAPTPYRVFAELDVKMKLPWPLPDPKAHIELEWKKEGEPPTPIPLSTVGIEHLKVSEKWLLDRFTGDGADSLTPNPIVPLDAKPVLSFSRPMVDAAPIGLNPSGVAAPERVGDYEFQCRLVKVTLKRKSNTSSEDFSVVASRSADDPDTDKNRFWGAWLAESGNLPTNDSSEISPMTKLMLFAKSPFELARETSDDTYYDGFSDENPTYGITLVSPPRKKCFGFDGIIDKNGGKKEDEKTASEKIREIRRDDVLIVGKDIQVHRDSANGLPYLVIRHDTGKTTAFIFPEPMRQVELLVGNSDATCSLYNGSQRVWEQSVSNNSASPQKVLFPNYLTQDFNLLIVDGHLELYRLCYVTAREADRFIDEEKTANHAMSACDAYRDLSDIELFLPNSLYELEVITETRRRHVDHGNWDQVETFTNTSRFQTANPPGIYGPSNAEELAPKGEEHYPKRGPLRDLTAYVSKVMPDEGARAIYRSYDVGVEFNEAYVEMMYRMAGKPLAIYLYDSNGQGLRAPDGGVPAAVSTSQENAEQQPARSDREWEATTRRAEERRMVAIEALGGQELAEEAGHPAAFSVVPQIELDAAPKQTGVWGGGEDFVLKPNSLYRAAVAAMVPRVAIPLTDEGAPVYVEEALVYYPLGVNGSDLSSAIEDSQAQYDTGMILISDGQNSILKGAPDEDAVQRVLGDWETYQILLEETLGSSEPVTEPRAVYSWSFHTSRFATFVHHIHSFVDAAWDLRATLGPIAWAALEEGDERRVALKELIETEPGRVQDIYDKALECFGLGDRPLPERLEINVLEDEHGQYGFFVESPEPIPWKLDGQGRVSLRVKKGMEEVASPTPAYGPAKLIGCNLGEEQVTLLVQADVDLAGYRIEQVNGEGDGGVLYYEFCARSRFQAGTVLQIHASEPPAEPTAGVDQKDLYGATAGIVSDAGSTLRLCDAKGREIHRRQFTPVPFVSYNLAMTSPGASRTFVLAPDADGTRTFLFLREKHDGEHRWLDDLADGVYRFDWTFERDAGDKLPVLRRCGSTSAERAVIEFKLPAELP